MAQESSRRESHAREVPPMCQNNCGFFGSRTTNNMCSKCYQEHSKLMETDAPLTETKVTTTASSSSSQAPPLETPERDDADAAPKTDTDEKKGPAQEPRTPPGNRCATCKRKVGLVAFDCRCGGRFCPQHRYADRHGCTFDYKRVARERIAEQNPVVTAEKINKI